MNRMHGLVLAAGAALLLAACEDPAKNKTKAVTTEATANAATLAAAGASAEDYAFDQNGSTLAWTGSKVTAKHDGSFGAFKGTVHVVDGSPEKGSVKVDIDTATLKTQPDMLVNHLKSKDFFDVATFPNATFASTEVKKGGEKGASHTITGNLTLHGVTKQVSFPANVTVTKDQVSVDAEFSINRKDFGLLYAGKADDLIRDDVVIKLGIHAKKP